MTSMTDKEMGEYGALCGKMKMSGMAREVKRAREELDEAKAAVTALQDKYDFLTITVVPARMEDEGIETLKVAGVGRLQSAPELRCSCPKENRGALYAWMKDNKHSSLVGSTINSSTLKAFVKEQMALGKEGKWPKDLLTVHPYERATVVKA